MSRGCEEGWERDGCGTEVLGFLFFILYKIASFFARVIKHL